MTNEEKATYIANANQCIDRSGYSSFNECKDSAHEMAEWKDQQFKDYLARKKSEYGIDYNVNPIDMLNEIIEELFGEDTADQSDNDE